MLKCRVCGQELREFMDLGRQPLANGFLRPEDVADEYFFHLVVGACQACTMVQLTEEVPRHLRYHSAYPYHTSGTVGMRTHFENDARLFLKTELTGPDPFFVEIGCNDGALLRLLAESGVRHLGLEPAGAVADMARAKGVRVRGDFFEESTAADVAAEDGPADVIFGANTICHVADVESLFAGVDALLKPDGVFVFEEPYVGSILDRTAFDQIYDEHFYLFSVRSVQAMADRFGFTLVDVERVPVHGGEIRYTVARRGGRAPRASV
ncbi:MAG TPA: methyltransferase domain-containing protein, partial [Micromonosporaceae bacterium]|nr:methyltransferase domain-containing protein [Micromonosporaceae bacterium]